MVSNYKRSESKTSRSFFKNKINLFGDYEDAVSKKSNTLFHSALSPAINIGLITPKEILEKINKFENKVRINSLEGYIRQIIGWREFMRGIYQNYNCQMENKNFFNHKNKMKQSWYNGTTGLEPLDYSIKNALNYGWSHHIERLNDTGKYYESLPNSSKASLQVVYGNVCRLI